MKRQAEEYLKKWYTKKNRKPLVIRGARQVGKSTTVRDFARSNNIELIEVNLEKHKRLNNLFGAKDIPELCRELEYLTGSDLSSLDNKLLFLDEIQAAPEAIPCLRYFREEMPGLALVSAGSLLEFTLSKHNYSMPVGRIEYLYMGPMNFIEYLKAQGEAKLIELLDNFKWEDPFSLTAHELLCSHLRDFLIVGGMPEAVNTFIHERSINDAIDIQISIIETYLDDFSKYASQSQLNELQNVFQHVPLTAGEKIKYVNINAHQPAREIKTAIELLEKAGIVIRVNHSDATGLPLKAGMNQKQFKLYFMDVGLLNNICGTRHLNMNLLRTTRFINEGNIAEQFIAQHLLYSGRPNTKPELYYWLREGKSNNAEVDFVVPTGGHVTPVEVKAGKSGTLKSLHQFTRTRNTNTCLRFDLNTPSRQQVEHILPNRESSQFNLISLPIYMVNRLDLLL